MKLTINTKEKTITLEEKASINDLLELLEKDYRLKDKYKIIIPQKNLIGTAEKINLNHNFVSSLTIEGLELGNQGIYDITHY